MGNDQQYGSDMGSGDFDMIKYHTPLSNITRPLCLANILYIWNEVMSTVQPVSANLMTSTLIYEGRISRAQLFIICVLMKY